MPSLLTPVAIVALLLGTGCGVAHGPGGRAGMAPALRSEPSAHNVANPNAPFSVRPVSAPPRLSQRPLLLDINNVEPCSPSQLSVWESAARSNGIHHSLRFSIGNAGEACRLRGFPSISLQRADGSLLGEITLHKVSDSTLSATLSESAATVSDSPQSIPSPAVLLPTKGEASFALGWTTGSSCELVSRIAIGVPGTGRAIVVPRSLVLCHSEVLITAVESAAGDN